MYKINLKVALKLSINIFLFLTLLYDFTKQKTNDLMSKVYCFVCLLIYRI